MVARMVFIYVHPSIHIGTDATDRYIPALEKIRESPSQYMNVNGPLYVFYLQMLEWIFGELKSFKVLLFQHALGVFSGMVTLIFFLRSNITLACNPWIVSLVIIGVFNSQLNLILEHTLMRENVVLALTTLIVIIQMKIISNKTIANHNFFTVSGLLVLLSLLRQETIFLWAIISVLNIFRRPSTTIIILMPGALLLLIILASEMYSNTHRLEQNKPYDGTKFNIAFHYLEAKNFRYKSKNFPQLVTDFAEIAQSTDNHFERQDKYYKASERYLKDGFFEGNVGVNELMDAIFVDQLLNNKIAFVSTYIENFKNLSIGRDERPDFKHPKQEWPLENGYSKSIALLYECIVSVLVPSWTYSTFMLITLCISALSVFILNNVHTNLSREFLLVTILYIAVVSFFANPVARFLHPIILIYTLSNLLFLNNLSKMIIERVKLIFPN